MRVPMKHCYECRFATLAPKDSQSITCRRYPRTVKNYRLWWCGEFLPVLSSDPEEVLNALYREALENPTHE